MQQAHRGGRTQKENAFPQAGLLTSQSEMTVVSEKAIQLTTKRKKQAEKYFVAALVQTLFSFFTLLHSITAMHARTRQRERKARRFYPRLVALLSPLQQTSIHSHIQPLHHWFIFIVPLQLGPSLLAFQPVILKAKSTKRNKATRSKKEAGKDW